MSEAVHVLEENRRNLFAKKIFHGTFLCLLHRSQLVFTADLDTGRSIFASKVLEILISISYVGEPLLSAGSIETDSKKMD